MPGWLIPINIKGHRRPSGHPAHRLLGRDKLKVFSGKTPIYWSSDV